MTQATRRHVFGPVPSRRLGRSLGVDLVPFKTCTYDCVYCQLGRTTNHTLERRAYVSLDEVLREVAEVLQAGAAPDFVTLSGSGEPTLFEPLGELIRGIKALTDVPVAVLTNGSLLWLPEVREGLADADLVVPSLDAGDDALFRMVNRPHRDMCFADMVAGLEQFCRAHTGRVWLEVFLLADLTAREGQVRQIADIARRLDPERIQLNTVARPPAEAWARAASPAELQAAAALLGPRCEVVADYTAQTVGGDAAAGEEAVLDLLRRRPCRTEDVASGLGLHRNEVVKYLEHLLRADTIATETVGDETYYKAARAPQPAGE